MKKVLILILVTLLTLVSCNSNNETTSNVSVLASTADDKSIETEMVSEDTTEASSSEFEEGEISEETRERLISKDRIHTTNAAVFEIETAYYNENGGIVVEGCIVNKTDHMASNLRVKNLEIFNKDDELIASNAFGYIQEHYGYVDAGEKFEISFTFPSVNVYIKDDDLDLVKSVSNFNSEHY